MHHTAPTSAPPLAQALAQALRAELARPGPDQDASGTTLLAAIATVLAAHVAPPFRCASPAPSSHA